MATVIALHLLFFPRDRLPRSRRRILLSLFTVLLFVINTADLVDTIGPLFIIMRKTLMDPLGGTVVEQFEEAENALTLWVKISNWLPSVELFISDLLVVWRAIAVWNENKWVKWGLSTLMIIDFGVNFAEGVTSDLPPSLLSYSRERQINVASLYISLGTNIVATGLIGFKFWRYRRSVRTILGKHRRTEMQKLLLLMVESGTVFLLVQFTMTIMTTLEMGDSDSDLGNPLILTYTVMEEIFEETCSLYPIVVIIMINNRSSIVDATVHSEVTAVAKFTEGSTSNLPSAPPYI
ncbi:hypothetical protein GYMLUDRAFT_730960 [Collybiopsis luxurians FD-317 M1]|nr:hypothetical protein GYMLUDRAFT_730960 [Collybiopsis luxurians FD-317 M1]